jgi:hypothetical protein
MTLKKNWERKLATKKVKTNNSYKEQYKKVLEKILKK